ncbi:Processive diacylglycerol beta-glucosyltransferase [compost metagenome]
MVILGHTKEISKWMDASDLLITKPGGMTCTEALAKGLPMLFCESIPGQEESNRQYFVTSGYGETLEAEAIDRWFERLTNRHRSVQSTSARHQTFKINYKPDRCAHDLVEMLFDSSSSTSLNRSSDPQALKQISM